jgi:3-oxo-5alpha-steroid 4-dehydrogenase
VGVASGVYVSGISLADCVFSGRNAGAHAAGRAGSDTVDTDVVERADAAYQA